MIKSYRLYYISRHLLIEAVGVGQKCSVKKVFLEILQISQENTCVGVSFLIKLPPFLKNTSDGCFCIQLLGSPNWISIKIFKIFYCFILNSFFLWNSSFCNTVTNRVEVVVQSILYWDFCFIWCEMVWPTTWNVNIIDFEVFWQKPLQHMKTAMHIIKISDTENRSHFWLKIWNC